MKAVILATGRGERLRPITDKLPKPLIKIGNLSVIEHQIALLKRYGIKDIIVITSYLSGIIEKKIGKIDGVKCIKVENPMGTASVVKDMRLEIGKKDFLVMYGDMMADICLKEFIKFHKNKKGICTLAVKPSDHVEDCDLLDIDENSRITDFFPKPRSAGLFFRNLDNACIYLMSPKIFKYIKNGKFNDFGKDIFPAIIKKEKLFGYNTAEYIKDMGTFSRLKEVRRDFSSKKIADLNREKKQKAVFLDRDGVIVNHIHHLHKEADLKLKPGAASAIKEINKRGFLAIVATNQSVVARGLCKEKDLKKIHNKIESQLADKGAKLDAIYYCPHHPGGFSGGIKKYKIRCRCRKPKIGMFLKAKKDFNIDFKKSYFVGDSKTDFLAAKRAGLKFFGIEKGFKKLAEAIK